MTVLTVARIVQVGECEAVSDYEWDTANLYTTGEVTLIPEPATWTLAVVAILRIRFACSHRRSAQR